jgi:hypothetical protein
MSLEQLNRSVDFVSDTAPAAADANDGETFLDTSLSPPRVKVFNDSAGAFVTPQVGRGVEFQNKVPRADFVGVDSVDVSGSGYLISIQADLQVSTTAEIDVLIDGSILFDGIFIQNGTEDFANSVSLFHRFESGFEVSLANNNGFGVVAYVLD